MHYTFPKHFRFGVADADLQVIGEKATREQEDAEETMWTHFAKYSGKCFNGDSPELGIDRYHKWQEDIAIMRHIGVKHYRTSISMSRLLKRNGDINTKAAEWYKAYFRSIQDAGISLYLTLYHWELPQWLHEEGGWLKRETVDYFTRFARIVLETFGEYVNEYSLFNEPWCASMKGYYHGQHAPGDTNLTNAILAAHHCLLAIGTSYKELHSIDKTLKLNTVFNTEPAYALTTDEDDILAARYADGVFNRWFMDPVYLGKYPEDIVELYGKHMPYISEEDMKVIKVGDKLHAFGHNYYTGQLVQYDETSELKFKKVSHRDGPFNDINWTIFLPPHYPLGLYDMLMRVYNSYKHFGLRRLYILENGIALNDQWDGKSDVVNDPRRVAYYQTHIKQVYDAIINGVPVESYFAWTFMDNYEWEEGYRPESRFGLIYVDRNTMKRVWKKSAHWYSQLLKTHRLSTVE